MRKRALIFGVTGQDGAYLSQLLLSKGYDVFGTSRDIATARLERLQYLGIADEVRLYSANLTDYGSVIQALHAVRPCEIYNLSAQSSVGLSFNQPIETLNSIGNATLNLLEAIRFLGGDVRLYNASSSEMFGDTGKQLASEMAAFRPHSPYAVSKAAAHWLVANYRKGYDLYACSGICFNHESPLRNERFVTQKIVRTAVDIKRGAARRLSLGNLAIVRDWGWAPEYVDAMWRMLQQAKADDYVIATGQPTSLEEFTRIAFASLSLDWRDHVDIDRSLFRPYELDFSAGDASKAARQLGWKGGTTMPTVVEKLVESELARR